MLDMSLVYHEPNTGCWLWGGPVDAAGYGRQRDGKKYRGAHRISYETYCGAIPDGFVIDHLCMCKCCVNPDHLQAVMRGNYILDIGRAPDNNGSRQAGAGGAS